MQDKNISIKTPEYVSLQFQPAGLGSRALAFMIDQVIMIVLSIIVLLLAFASMAALESLMIGAPPAVPIAIAIILIFLINVGYFLVLEYYTGGRTVGKKVLKIRVIQDNGHSITLLSSFIRNFMRLIDSLPTSYLLGILMIFFHPDHKRLGDVVAGTLVVHERGKQKVKKESKLDLEIARRGITKDDIAVDEWAIKSLGSKEWKLLKVYSDRFCQLPTGERWEFTNKMAKVLFEKIGLVYEGKSIEELENTLLALYLRMREEWEYDL
ncbi:MULTISPECIES: RDD family protein [Bacillaceae]|uniref:RDD family protein n=1 Tax=Evansella alkalicola TaxID=745819 RepID=A0ABS6JV10_9BACI|nr:MULTISPECIES: RDD family protein [Bacillaceae]MBU9722374.1 RDD family protein [Bacillus alkalicola]